MTAEESNDIFLAELHAISVAKAKSHKKTIAGMNLCINTSFVYEGNIQNKKWLKNRDQRLVVSSQWLVGSRR